MVISGLLIGGQRSATGITPVTAVLRPRSAPHYGAFTLGGLTRYGCGKPLRSLLNCFGESEMRLTHLHRAS